MNEMQVFTFEGNDVRTVVKDGNPWWVLKDVCDALTLTTPTRVAERLEEDEVSQTHVIDSIGRSQETTIINESGLYNVIIRSDKPNAARFRRWITHSVLPSIRKHGMYAADELLDNPDLLICALEAIKAERAKSKLLEETVGVQAQQIVEMHPKVSYYNIILNCADAISITQIAKDYGKSAIWLNSYLHDKGIQFKQGDIWLLYQKYAEQGYTCTKTHNYLGKEGTMHAKVHTYYTQKGRLFLYGLLKEDGILPLMEREQLSEIA